MSDARYRRPQHRFLGAAWLVLGIASACFDPPQPAGDAVLPAAAATRGVQAEQFLSPNAIPQPDPATLSDSARRQIDDAREALERTLRQEGVSPRSAEAWGQLGMTFEAYGLDAAATDCYGAARGLEASDARWPYLLGRRLRAAGDTAGARRELAAASKLDVSSEAIAITHAELLLEIGALDAAEAIVAAALARVPSPAAQWVRGRLAHRNGDAAAAAAAYEAALRAAPSATEIHYPLGLAYRDLGRLDEAERFLGQRGNVPVPMDDPLQEAIDALASGARVHMMNGNQAFLRGDLEAAESAYRLAVEDDPQNAEALGNLAATLGRLGRSEEARRILEQALAISPDDPKILFNLGSLSARSGDDVRATELYSRALEADPRNKNALFNLANAERRRGRTAAAEARYRALLEVDPANGPGRLALVFVILHDARWSEALSMLEESHALLPEAAPITAALTRLLAATPPRAERDGRRALVLADALVAQVSTLDHVEVRALALAELGRFEEAMTLQDAAIRAARQAGNAAAVRWLEANLERFRAGQSAERPYAADEPLLSP